MKSETELKELVKEKYGAIASQPASSNLSTACCDDGHTIMADDYTQLEGYQPEADLGLGCGIPTVFAQMKAGDTVVDLGSGAGNDSFIARSIVGENGKVIGIDFTTRMIEKARMNAENFGFNNVEFRYGDIESIPLTSNRADVVLSNCVLNLVPNKHKVFSEIFRVLKPGGHFSISDIVLQGTLPQKLEEAAEMYAGCVSGASQKEDYLSVIHEAGFSDVEVQKEKKILIPDQVLSSYLNEEEMLQLKNNPPGIYSITVYGQKPAKDERNCCEPGSGCC